MAEESTAILKISNERGLHARASAKFVNCVEKYDAEIRVSKDGHVVGGTSIMGLMMLAADKGSTIHVSATGGDAKKVLAELEALLERKFDERE